MDNWYYILDGHTPVPADVLAWGKWYETAGQNGDRKVAHTVFDDAEVSTVFLGLNHAFDDGPPMLFETMIFGGPHNDYQERCSTWEQAEAMHARACQMASSG